MSPVHPECLLLLSFQSSLLHSKGSGTVQTLRVRKENLSHHQTEEKQFVLWGAREVPEYSAIGLIGG